MTTKDHLLLDLSLENTEAVFDAVTENTFIKEIPVVRTITGAFRAARDIRDRLLAAKIGSFLFSLGDVSNVAKEQMRKRVAQSQRDSAKVGETILLVLDRAIEMEKGEIIASLFMAFVYEHILADDFRRFRSVVDQAYLGDLRRFLETHKLPQHETGGFMQHLLASGVTEVVPGQTFDQIGKLFVRASSLGNALKTAYFQGKSHIREQVA